MRGVRTAVIAAALAAAIAAACTRGGDPAWRAELERERAAKDAHFRTSEGPLPEAARSTFRGLRYFAPDPDWDIAQAMLDPAATPDTLGLLTSTGTRDLFERAGFVRFRYRGTPHALVLYRSIENDQFFLPFTDATSGKETYGAGRYVEVVPTREGGLHVDFNRAYNPYCAYDSRWTCPLPPPENHLAIRVEAGEKAPGGH